MAVLKCKMCGGSLKVVAGEVIAECEYCGTQQTLPKTTDENIQALFNRANLLRQRNEFDKAEEIYEKILLADDTEAEAYWGVILCKFGIEYVEDPKTYKRVPTCHRSSYDSIVADAYYGKALEYADDTQRSLYEAEAKKIDEIQKGILAISAQEEPYDVFICYKETDESGKRTPDSVIANEIYHQLTQEGFKVFYAAISLEDKLGSAYEPIIFAALNSSKVMLSIGTKPEYFNAVWVKNEWSRFLKMMKNDHSKMLIPCYKGMDAYELPEEFAHLQAQDMGKIGFISDIVRGIKKVVVKNEHKPSAVKETVAAPSNFSVAPLLKRAFMFLEDEDWKSAEEYAEKVLDMDPENAEAYLVKFLLKFHLQNRSLIVDAFDTSSFQDENTDFQKAMRFADESLREELRGYIATIAERYERKRLPRIYEAAHASMAQDTSKGYSEAASLFESIKGYLDSQELHEECLKSLEKAEERRKNEIYARANLEAGRSSVESLLKAIKLFESIPGWSDADEQRAACEAKLKIKAEKARKRTRWLVIILSAFVVLTIILVLSAIALKKSAKYDTLLSYMESEQYVQALALSRELYGYKDTETIYNDLFTTFKAQADELYLSGEAREAANFAINVGLYRDDQDNGYLAVANGDYKTAVALGFTHIVIPNGVTSIGRQAFHNCTGLTSITIPESVTFIGSKAFYYCTSLTSITIPESVTGIDWYAFSGCTGLTSITIPESVTGISQYAFKGCTGLTSITIPESVTAIGWYAFEGCTGLTSITIPASVTSIGQYAFSGCTGLTAVTFEDYIGWEAEGKALSWGDLKNKTTAAKCLTDTYSASTWTLK